MRKLLRILFRVGIVFFLGAVVVFIYYMFFHEEVLKKRNENRTYTPMYKIIYEDKEIDGYKPLSHLEKTVSSKEDFTVSPENINYLYEIEPIKKFTSLQIKTSEGDILEEVFFNDKKQTSEGYGSIYIHLTSDIVISSNRSFKVIPYELIRQTDSKDKVTEDNKSNSNHVSEDRKGNGVIIEDVEDEEIEDVTIP